MVLNLMKWRLLELLTSEETGLLSRDRGCFSESGYLLIIYSLAVGRLYFK